MTFKTEMCLIAWRWNPELPDSLILLSNRDEYYERPTRQAAQWPGTRIWAGQDERASGSWLGVTDAGRLAAITNHRSASANLDTAISRGSLVSEFLSSDVSGPEFVAQLADRSEAYNPFNLLLFDGRELLGFEGRGEVCQTVQLMPGYGGVSNADFNSPWHKQVWLQSELSALLEEGDPSDDELLDLLLNEHLAPFDRLPATGIPIEREVALSAPFVRMGNYGTRASTLVRIRKADIVLVERNFDAGAPMVASRHLIAR